MLTRWLIVSRWLTPVFGALRDTGFGACRLPLWQLRQQVIDLMPVETKARSEAEVANVLQRQLELSGRRIQPPAQPQTFVATDSAGSG